MTDYSICSTKAKLLLSPGSFHQKKLIDIIEKAELWLNGDELQRRTLEEISNLADELTTCTQKIIELEWNNKQPKP